MSAFSQCGRLLLMSEAAPGSARHSAPERQVYRFDGCLLDPARRAIVVGTELADPPARVFDFLLYLVENRDRLVSKQELLGRFWPSPEASEDSLFKAVRQARQLLRDNAKAPRYIRTVHGVGYQFIAAVEAASDHNGPAADTVAAGMPPPPRKRRFTWLASGVIAVAAVLAIVVAGRRQDEFEIAWFRFEETEGSKVADSSGHGHEGLIQGDARFVRAIAGKGLEFGGKSSYVRGTTPGTKFPVKDEPRTISAWIRLPALPEREYSIFSYGRIGPEPPSNRVHLAVLNSGLANFSLGHGHGGVNSTIRVDGGAWHHVAAVYSGPPHREARLYIDGNHQGSSFLSRPEPSERGSEWNIGLNVAGGLPLQGELDDLRLFARALTHPEVFALHRCCLARDIVLPGGAPGYYLPLSRATVGVEDGQPAHGGAVPFDYEGFNLGGVQFAAAEKNCALAALRGVSLPADLEISAELSGGLGDGIEVGPYARARSVRPGEDAQAMGHGGWWVRLTRNGRVRICSLNQQTGWKAASTAESEPVAGFDFSTFHELSARFQGRTLEVRLDGRPVLFRKSGKLVPRLGLEPNGSSDGAAGIGFAVPGSPLYSAAPRIRSIRLRSLPE